MVCLTTGAIALGYCVVQVLCVTSMEPDGSTAVTAKISDFGLALRAMPLPSGRGWDTVRTPPRGTPLYMAPELFKDKGESGCVEARAHPHFEFLVSNVRARALPQLRHTCDHCDVCLQVSQMSDVYSFGVLLVFLFTGNHASSVPQDIQVRKRAP